MRFRRPLEQLAKRVGAMGWQVRGLGGVFGQCPIGRHQRPLCSAIEPVDARGVRQLLQELVPERIGAKLLAYVLVAEERL